MTALDKRAIHEPSCKSPMLVSVFRRFELDTSNINTERDTNIDWDLIWVAVAKRPQGIVGKANKVDDILET